MTPARAISGLAVTHMLVRNCLLSLVLRELLNTMAQADDKSVKLELSAGEIVVLSFEKK